MAKSNAVARQDTGFDAMALLEAAGIQVSEILDAGVEIGDGWQVIDKASLVGVQCIIVDYKFSESKEFRNANGEGRGFVILKVITNEFVESNGAAGKWVVTDGGTGIFTQLGEWVEARDIDLKADKVPALILNNGFTVSEYDYTDDKGNVSRAKTYYIP